MTGKVYLVGGGPGAPGLITVKGAECLRRADVVLYDALVNARLLDLAPPGAERILVGKRHGKVTVDQDEIERILVEHARAGRTVVRLKGGDPFVFGRGGEEAEACRRKSVPFEIVPGVTAAIAVPAYAGIPLTHREHASNVTFVTGRPGDARPGFEHDWEALARVGGTLVFLMAALRTPEIASHLQAAGMDARTPAAAIRWGTTPRQRTVRAPLSEIAEHCRAVGLRPPVVLVVGDVAALADELAWYERLPLFGRRIVVTRAAHQAGALVDRIEAAGGEAIPCPVIAIAAPDDPSAVEAAYERVGSYDWLVLTSPNGAASFFDGFLAGGRDVRALAGVRIAAIGPATAAVVERRGIRVAARPTEYRAEALLEALGDVAGARVLLARATDARAVLPRELGQRGATVDVVALYRTVRPSSVPSAASLAGCDMITFTSSSTVTNFVELLGEDADDLLRRSLVAAIGPITAETLRARGVEPDVVPADYTIDGLVTAICGYFANRESVK